MFVRQIILQTNRKQVYLKINAHSNNVIAMKNVKVATVIILKVKERQDYAQS